MNWARRIDGSYLCDKRRLQVGIWSLSGCHDIYLYFNRMCFIITEKGIDVVKPQNSHLKRASLNFSTLNGHLAAASVCATYCYNQVHL